MILFNRLIRTTTAGYRYRSKYPAGRYVCTDRHSGQRYRLTHKGSAIPSKYLGEYPCPHSRMPLHTGHRCGFGHEYLLPRSYSLFTSTGKYSNNTVLLERALGNCRQTENVPAALSLPGQLILLLSRIGSDDYKKNAALKDRIL